jgi:hypothetical protein
MMGRHKKVMCKVCYREMRSDVLARHMKQHSMRNESSPVTNISVTNNYNTISGVSTERKDEENENKDEELKKYLIKIENEYQEKLVQGKKIYKMLGEGVVSYQALPREMKEDVDHYMENQADFRDVENVELKPWQESLLEYVQQPCDREIFWIIGKEGNEGKNWFQKYVKSWLGARRVVTGIDIKANNASIFQALRKCPIVTADIFLFNIGKSMKKFDQINYDALEKMKDGEAFASKYDSQQLKIRVPNVVMVFSNSPPDVRELAKVRFRVFNINNNQLQKKNIVEIKDPKEKKENAESDSDVDSVLSDL